MLALNCVSIFNQCYLCPVFSVREVPSDLEMFYQRIAIILGLLEFFLLKEPAAAEAITVGFAYGGGAVWMPINCILFTVTWKAVLVPSGHVFYLFVTSGDTQANCPAMGSPNFRVKTTMF